MPKINQEEYEVLKEALNEGYEWIARDSHNPLCAHRHEPTKQDHWIQQYWGNVGNGYKEIDDRLFQFIQWEDEEPHNIQELIEEYEKEAKDKETDLYTRRMKYIAQVFSNLNSESEETEVKKDIEWAKKEIKELMTEESQNYPHDEMVEKEIVLGILNQLDEPEVLSQEWINRHTDKFVGNEGFRFVNTKDLQNLLVPKQEELTDEQIARKVDQAYKDGYEKGKEHATEKQSEETETVARVLVDYLIASAKLKLALSMEVEELEE